MATTKKTAAAPVNLFATAKEDKKKKSTAKGDDKKMINAPTDEISEAIANLIMGRDMIKKGESLTASSEAIIKPFALGEWMKEFKETKKQPESFNITNGEETVMYIVQDGYKKIEDEERAEYLKETYGEEIVDESETEFVVNKDLIEKYAEAISKAIMNIKEIPDEDKANLFRRRPKYKVAKGTIANIIEIAAAAKTTPETVFSEITPTQQLKGRGKAE